MHSFPAPIASMHWPVRDECQATRLLPIDECVGHAVLTDPGSPVTKTICRSPLLDIRSETLVKLGERVITSDQDLRGTRRRRALPAPAGRP